MSIRSPILLGRRINDGFLVAKTIILALEALMLLLHNLKIAVFLVQLLLETGNLARLTSISELLRFLPFEFWVATETLDLFLETELVEDHDVGAVENEGQEEGKAAEIHVALRVELAGLDLHAGRAAKRLGSSNRC